MSKKLFYRDFRDALRQLVAEVGNTASLGAEMWPAKGLGSDNWLQDCLSSTRKAKLDLEEIIYILKRGRDEGEHFAFEKLCDELGYEHPGIVTPKTQEQLLAEKFERQARELRNTADELAACRTSGNVPQKIRAVNS